MEEQLNIIKFVEEGQKDDCQYIKISHLPDEVLFVMKIHFLYYV